MAVFDAVLETQIADRQLRTVLAEAATAVQLAFDRALAHRAAPETYPLPRRPDALERRINRQVGKLSAEALGQARDAALARLAAPPAQRRAHYGRLADIDVKSRVPTVDQVRSLPRLDIAGAAHDQLLARIRRAAPRAGRPAGRPGPSARKKQKPDPAFGGPPEWLVLRAKRLHCIADTSERFRDEIEIAGVSTDLCSGECTMLPPQKLGKWKKGQNQALNPVRTLARYRLGDGPEAAPFIATLVLAEADLGGLAGHVRDLHTVHEVGFLTDVVVGAVSMLLADVTPGDLAKAGLIGAGLAVVLPGLFMVLMGVLAGVCVVLLLDRVFRRLGDEIFNDVPVSQVVGARGARFPGRPAGALTSAEDFQEFRGPRGDGRYKLTYDWAIVTG
jgi:hypothetical protein